MLVTVRTGIAVLLAAVDGDGHGRLSGVVVGLEVIVEQRLGLNFLIQLLFLIYSL
jgi:hypothetical protein